MRLVAAEADGLLFFDVPERLPREDGDAVGRFRRRLPSGVAFGNRAETVDGLGRKEVAARLQIGVEAEHFRRREGARRQRLPMAGGADGRGRPGGRLFWRLRQKIEGGVEADVRRLPAGRRQLGGVHGRSEELSVTEKRNGFEARSAVVDGGDVFRVRQFCRNGHEDDGRPFGEDVEADSGGGGFFMPCRRVLRVFRLRLRSGCRLGLLLGGGCRFGLLLGGGGRLVLLLRGGCRLGLLLRGGCRLVLRMQRDDAEQQEKENIFKTSHGR